MGILGTSSNYQNCIKSTNKIPPYAINYKKEYLYIRGLNKEFKYLINKLDNINNGLFTTKNVDRIKSLIKKFLKAQEKGKLKDISEFMLPKYDYVFIKDFYCYFNYENEFDELVSKLYEKIKIELVFSDYYGEGYYV